MADSAYVKLKAYCRTVRVDSSRQIIQEGEPVGYWQTAEWIAGLLELCQEDDLGEVDASADDST